MPGKNAMPNGIFSESAAVMLVRSLCFSNRGHLCLLSFRVQQRYFKIGSMKEKKAAKWHSIVGDSGDCRPRK
jgi:hypothetical protein